MSTLPRFEVSPLPRSLAVEPPFSDEEFEAFCLQNDDLRIERTSEGAIRMNPPTGAMTGDGNAEITYQLRNWWHTHEKGRVFDSSAGFFLPDGSMLSPDACYVTAEQLAGVTRKQLTGLLRLAPAFVIELLSPTDRLAELAQKMESWIANGVEVGWLIDPYERKVTVYKPGHETLLSSTHTVEGSGPVAGFSFELTKLWRCYEVPEE
jgi:Uma2 family endonuclease